MSAQSLSTPERTMGQSKIRKGTHSCWECRRRKIRCQFSSADDSACTQCNQRGTVCRKQNSTDQRPPAQQRDRSYRQRLDRLEEMMQRLADRILPDENIAKSGSTSSCERQPTISMPRDGNGSAPLNDNVSETSLADKIPVGSLLGLSGSDCSSPSMLMPELTGWSATSPGPWVEAKAMAISEALHPLFPAQQAINTITQWSPGTLFVTKYFCSNADIIAGRAEPPASIAVVPSIHDHPSVLARKLLQLAICMQQLGPSFNEKSLGWRLPVAQVMVNIISSVSNLVTSNDDIVGNPDGLECLVLQGIWQTNVGNLRKAWLIFRRALSLAHLMCFDSGSCSYISANESERIEHRTSSYFARMWYIIVANDRFLSLFLGLRVGTLDDSFASDEAMKTDSPEEKLEKLHSLISARIVERNFCKTSQTYVKTQAIDSDLETVAKRMGQDWWVSPNPTACATAQQAWESRRRLMIQIHHDILLIMVHLPYLLHDPIDYRYTYSKLACIRSSRRILGRFIIFRTGFDSVHSCRHIDYSCSIAAMTLLLSYLVQGDTFTGETGVTVDQREEDMALVVKARDRLEDVSLLNHDKVSQESAHIIDQLLPVLDITNTARSISLETGQGTHETVRLSIPYLGIVSISPNHKQAKEVHQHSYTPSLNSIQFSGTDSELGSLRTISSKNHAGNMFLHVEPPGPDDDFGFGLTAEANNWPFQGIDTNFWSLVNSSMPWQ